MVFFVKMSDIIKYNVAVESLDEIRNSGFDVIIKLVILEQLYFLQRVVKKLKHLPYKDPFHK